jgi:hypothetical protein
LHLIWSSCCIPGVGVGVGPDAGKVFGIGVGVDSFLHQFLYVLKVASRPYFEMLLGVPNRFYLSSYKWPCCR